MTDEDDRPENNQFRVNSRLQVTETSSQLLNNASRSIKVLLYDYDDTVLPTTELDALLPSFIRKHERNRFHYLCSESDLLRGRGGKLVALARRYSTFIKLRQLPEGLKPVHDQFIVIDSLSSIQTQDHRSYDYYAHIDDRARARLLENRFEELWSRSEAVPGVHVTGL